MQSGDEPERRRELLAPLDRLQDLYVMGDLTKGQYVMRRQTLEEEVQRIGPPIDPGIAKAEALLDDFTRFWAAETTPSERHKLVARLFEQIWQDAGRIVAVKPKTTFARYFQTIAEIQEIHREIPATPTEHPGCQERERRESNPRLTPPIEIRL